MPRSDAVLCDTGPLVSLYDRDDTSHAPCLSALSGRARLLRTTWPVLAEAMYLLGKARRQELLWELILRGGLVLEDIQGDEVPRVHQLMRQYENLPLDLADASLIVVAERLNLRQIFTLDRHFRIVRPRHARSFDIFP